MVDDPRVPFLRVAIGALTVAALLTQIVVIPRVAFSYADRYPEVAHLAPPYVAAIVVAVGGFEIALLAVWQLLSTARGEDSSRRPKLLARIMTASLGLMAVLFAGVFAHASFVAKVGGPPVFLGLLASIALVPGAVVVGNMARRRFSLEDVRDG